MPAETRLVITIPVLLLWNSRISWKKKLLLMSIFSLTVIVIIISIVRISLIISSANRGDISWLYLWSNIEVVICMFSHLCTLMLSLSLTLEPFTAIIVACLASFRQLYVKSDKPGRIQAGSYQPLWGNSFGGRSSYTRQVLRLETPSKPDSTEKIAPLDAIHVGHRTSVLSTSAEQAI